MPYGMHKWQYVALHKALVESCISVIVIYSQMNDSSKLAIKNSRISAISHIAKYCVYT